MIKIEKLKELGFFSMTIDDDPPTIPLTPDNVDYLKEDPVNVKKSEIINS